MNPEKQQDSNVPERDKTKTHEEAYRFLTNLPEGLDTSDQRLKDWAKKYNETICISVSPQQAENDWYVYYNGKGSKIAPIVNPAESPRAYLVYY